ncbi:MAG: putative amidotransferase [Eubacterium sp.]|jgi:GMP synthase-like glutamine amidotransferase|nr:putative amidotransferase [Eubacterium sp.]
MRIHYLQHVPFENPGAILSWAEQRKYPVTSTRFYENQPLPDQNDFDWLIIMGGPMNIYEDKEYPWLISEKEFIRASINSNKFIIGICLGGQLIADVIGGRVIQNEYKEIGWFPVNFTDPALALHQFSFMPKKPVVFQWHGDTFIDLPEEAVLLASNEACKNQAFIYKNRVYGFQFHMECNMEIISDLIENCRNEMIPGQYIQSAGKILAEKSYMDRNNQWIKLFLSQLSFLYDESWLV